MRAAKTNAQRVRAFGCYAPLFRGGYTQTLNLRPKQARLLRFKFCIRDTKKIKAQICAENGSNLKSNLTAAQQKVQPNLNEKD
ncbi:hypothetical protein [Campylobacter showae]|uniref:hypothetical protein n=1 Tax=Campylobacter showae TaxID=204 RepID=UPI0028D3611D|nr:hypothetical protein [Campylobacter showae]